MSNKPSVLSLFSGCGGLDLGFCAAGFDTFATVEIANYAAATLRRNFASAKVIGPPEYAGDIRNLDLSLIPADPDLLIGGPPCQSFSIAAAQRFLKGDKKFKRTGFSDRVRGNLIHDYLNVLALTRPAVFVIENVPGLRELDGGRQLADILDTVRRLGYRNASTAVLQAADYGVPQSRQRLIILGSRGRRKVSFPSPTHRPASDLFTNSSAMRVYTSVVEALARIPVDVENHVARDHLGSSIARYRRLHFGQREKLGRVDRLHPMRPSKTVIAGGSNGGGRSHLHPFLARTLTVRECARLQTFPDSFVFEGNMSRQFTQVGNAVPPLLAEHIARAIGRSAFGLEYPEQPQLAINARQLTPGECLSDVLESSLRESSELLYNDFVLSAQLSLAS